MKHSILEPRVPLVYSPSYSIPWDPKHRFPMAKYRLLYEQLVMAGIARSDNTHISTPCSSSWIELAHCADYVKRFVDGGLSTAELKTLGLTWSLALVQRTLTAVSGTTLTCRLALKHKLACHLAGGTHHAFSDQGKGFCVFNDLAVAAKVVQQKGWAKRILILDCDVHQGDGTAQILADDPDLFTCSIHAANNYPFDKQRSDLDVALPSGLGDSGYLDALNQSLAQLALHAPFDLLIYDGGSDVHQNDRLGLLELTDAGVRARDLRVMRWAQERNLPVACVIGGGYDHDHHRLAQRHALLIESAQQHFSHIST